MRKITMEEYLHLQPGDKVIYRHDNPAPGHELVAKGTIYSPDYSLGSNPKIIVLFLKLLQKCCLFDQKN